VGTFVVEDFDKFFEARLLLKKIGDGRLSGLFLQSQMHALMTPVLLRMAGWMRSIPIPGRSHHTASLLKLNNACAEANGTPLSLRMLAGRPRSFEQPLKHCESVLFPGRRKGFTGRQKPAGVIGDGQRIAVLVITQQEFTFVIGTPTVHWVADPTITRFPAHGDALGLVALSGVIRQQSRIGPCRIFRKHSAALPHLPAHQHSAAANTEKTSGPLMRGN
jgi:hypothetical protein